MKPEMQKVLDELDRDVASGQRAARAAEALRVYLSGEQIAGPVTHSSDLEDDINSAIASLEADEAGDDEPADVTDDDELDTEPAISLESGDAQRPVGGVRDTAANARESTALIVLADGKWHSSTEVYQAMYGAKSSKRGTLDALIQQGRVQKEGARRGLRFRLLPDDSQQKPIIKGKSFIQSAVALGIAGALDEAFATGTSYDKRELLRYVRNTIPLVVDIEHEIAARMADGRLDRLPTQVGDRFRRSTKGKK